MSYDRDGDVYMEWMNRCSLNDVNRKRCPTDRQSQNPTDKRPIGRLLIKWLINTPLIKWFYDVELWILRSMGQRFLDEVNGRVMKAGVNETHLSLFQCRLIP